jgi:replicative DNA helicase
MNEFPMDRDEELDTAPHHVEAEQQVLGCILANNDAFSRVDQLLVMEDFYDPVHQRLFDAISNKVDAGTVATPITLRPIFQNDEGMAELGGPAYMVRLMGAAMGTAFIADYAHVVKDMASKRLLLAQFQNSSAEIREGIKEASDIALEVENEAGRIATVAAPKKRLHSFMGASEAAIRNIDEAYRGERIVGVSTGIKDLDRVMGSLRDGESTVLAGRPAMGKTTLAHNIAISAAFAGHGVFFASLEMLAAELANRAFANLLARTGKKVAYSDMRSGKLSGEEYRAVLMAAQSAQNLPILTGEKECRDVSKFRSAARRAQQIYADTETPLGLVVVDYVQKLKDPRARNDYANAGAVSDAVKNLAMDLGVPVLGLSQLNRDVEKREPPIPMLSDLRDSGKLEEDADNVLFAYRPAYYLQKQLEMERDLNRSDDLRADLASVANDLNIIVAKQRSGPTATATAEIHIKYNFVGHMADTSQEAFAI